MLTDLDKDYIRSVCKLVPAMAYTDSVTHWFEAIARAYKGGPRMKPDLASQFVFIWLSQAKGITIQNLDSVMIE